MESNRKYTKSQRRKIRKDEQKQLKVLDYQKRKEKFRKRQQKRKKLLKPKSKRKVSL
jgi:hypothetical protein